ncbi:MAG TPA: putative LPS assembly protein LptD [Bacteroidales bacterium]|nr:putative LPS assembly protein LptD [Bacteroidales bacterium]
MVHSLISFSQENTTVRDSVNLKNDSLLIKQDNLFPGVDSSGIRQDSIPVDTNQLQPVNTLESQVVYSAQGYTRQNLVNRTVVLVSAAKVTYGDIEINADSIWINMNSNILYAVGRKDTTGKVIGSPIFKEGSSEIAADDLYYNFKTKRARASNIETKQSEGLLRSSMTKLLEDGTSNISKSTYSTCDANPPHFYINLPKAKIYPGEKLVSGPGNLVLEGIPLPLILPFGYFPINTRSQASGILIPHFGQETERGYNLTDGGYYFAINEYVDLKLRGSVYANGTWMLNTESNYVKKYRYSGNFSFSYANNVTGIKGLENHTESSNYRVGWTYAQDPKASPGSRFAASVNMSSASFDKSNSYNVTEHVTTQRQSSISYQKSWEGTPFNFSTSMNHTQDIKTKDVNLNLPKANFNMSRIYPLKSRNMVGKAKWWQDVQFSYTAQLDNRIATKDSLLFTKHVWENMKNGFSHQAPISLQIRPFKNFSISPSLTYNGVLYTQKTETYLVSDPETGVESVVSKVVKGPTYGHALNPAFNASYNTQVIGSFKFADTNYRRIQEIRHVMKPSVGFSYIPYLNGFSSKMYRQVQGREYSIYDGAIYGTPALSKRSGSVSFSLSNIVEAKVFAKNDTTGKPKKVKIIDNLGLSTSYNIFADKFKWAPLSVNGRTTLANNINISASSTFSFYGKDSVGNFVDRFALKNNGKFMFLTGAGASLDVNVSDLFSGDKDKAKTGSTPNALTGGVQNTNPTNSNDLFQSTAGNSLYDEYGYAVFNVPWTMNLSYSINYSKTGLKSVVSSAMILNGSLSLTKKTSMTYTTGYDFKGKEVTMTQIGIMRDLHCWQMSFNWVPNGTMKMWNFTIRVKATVLGDLKYERRKDFHDTY